MSGRSRGRARVSTVPQPASAPSPSGGHTGGSLSGNSNPPSPPPIGSAQSQTPSPPPIQPQPGRGRGFTTTAAESIAPTVISSAAATTVAATLTSITTATTQSTLSVERISPSSESPPQQPSPTQPTPPMGRAALRGGPHQPPPNLRTEVLGEMERLKLQDQGDLARGGQERRPDRYEQVLRTRPPNCDVKTGTQGKSVRILCNYFEVLNKPDWVLYQYHVDFSPVIESRKMRLGLFRNHDALFPLNKAFDGSTLYSLTKLENEVTEVASKRETDQTIITIKIKRIGEIVPTSPQFVHLFNVVFRRCLTKYGMKQIDRNFYDTKNKVSIKEYRLELIHGFSTSIANYENKLLLCAELTHRLLHTTTIHQLMANIWEEVRGDESQFKSRCTAEIVGRVIMTKYNEKTYKIDDINWDLNPRDTFDTYKGKVSFIDYYKNNYEININDPSQPLLTSLPSERDKRRGQTTAISLVPELCVITGVSDKMREDFRFKRAVDAYTKVGAKERCQKLAKFVETFNKDEKVQAELDKWLMNFSARPAQISGRMLEPESIGFGQNIMKKLNEKADWSNEMKGTPLLGPIELRNWIIIYPRNKEAVAGMFVNTYGDIINSMKIKADPPASVEIPRDDPDLIVNALKKNITEKTQLVVVLVTSKRKDRYDAIKRICCLEKPVPSQVVTSQIIEDDKKRKSVITKVAIQMNCKLGGEIWKLHIPINNVMICGIDTYHDSSKKKGSVCSFIATSNADKTKFFSRATLQESHQELSNNLTITVKSACDHYSRVNGVYPEKIIIYRDGISDGQLPLVMEYEIPQIQKGFELIDPAYKPLMTFIVVKKRGNARFFMDTGNDIINPPCGTVIDTVVTRQEWFDFYLISQNVNQGTVNPTHYNVVYESIGLKPDHYQRLSYKLTHLYYNWPGTIRVPAVCQYAHKLAFLVGQSLHKEHNASLCDKLFYL